MLGAGSMRCKFAASNPTYASNHGWNQAEYNWIKYLILEPFVGTPPRKLKNGGYGNYYADLEKSRKRSRESVRKYTEKNRDKINARRRANRTKKVREFTCTRCQTAGTKTGGGPVPRYCPDCRIVVDKINQRRYDAKTRGYQNYDPEVGRYNT